MKSLKVRLVDACIIFSVTLFILAGLEIAARLTDYFPGPYIGETHDQGNPAVRAHSLSRNFQTDLEHLRWRYSPYVAFRARAYASLTMNVDEEGRRKVLSNCEKLAAFTIWTFGGSTMFGAKAPDGSTIPSQLANLLNRETQCARLVNYGAPSWQSSQSLIQLMQELSRGAIPDAVVFYNGIDDAEVVASGAEPGGIDPAIEKLLKQALENKPKITMSLAQQFHLVRWLMPGRFRPGPTSVNEMERAAVITAANAKAKASASIYAANIRAIDAIAMEYDFKVYYFLQPFPAISGKRATPLEDSTIALDTKFDWERRLLLYRTFYRALRQNEYLKTHSSFHDFSGLFDGMPDELFADSQHLLPAGNRIVAERIAQTIAVSPGKAVH